MVGPVPERVALRANHVHARFRLVPGLCLAMMLIGAIFAAQAVAAPFGASAPGTCKGQTALRPVTIDVPINGSVMFDIDDLLRSSPEFDACHDLDTLGAAAADVLDREGRVAITGTSQWMESALLGTEIQPSFVFQVHPGFRGISPGWQFEIYRAGNAGQRLRLGNAAGVRPASSTSLGTVQVNFRVRNDLPIAVNEAVKVAPQQGETDVAAVDGVLANDFDANGDPLVVHAGGVSSFPWGSVEIRRDGSYRVLVTDPDLARPARVRYVIWDTEGSPTSTDTGVLMVTFVDPGAVPGVSGEDDAPLTNPIGHAFS